jgi:hypothetical protein
MSSGSLGHVVRDAHNKRASESMNRFFRWQPDDEADGEASEFVNLDAGAGATSPPPTQPINGNAIIRAVFDDAVAAKAMRRTWG